MPGPLIVSLGTLGYQDFVVVVVALSTSQEVQLAVLHTYVMCIEVELCKEGLLQIEI